MAKSVTAFNGSNDPSPGLILFCAVCYLITVLLSRSWLSLCSLICLGILGLLLLRIRPFHLLFDIRKSWFILGLTFVIHWIVNSHYLGINSHSITQYFNGNQAEVALRFTIRFALILAVIAGLQRLHDMQRYGRSVGQILSKIPFGKGLFARIELIATLALRMIPFIQDQHTRLGFALEARGEKKSDSLFGRIRRMKRLLFPLVAHSIRRADRTAVALQIRGYDPEVERSSMQELGSSLRSRIIAIIFIVLTFVSLYY